LKRGSIGIPHSSSLEINIERLTPTTESTEAKKFVYVLVTHDKNPGKKKKKKKLSFMIFI
jgi:hypothetical protein